MKKYLLISLGFFCFAGTLFASDLYYYNFLAEDVDCNEEQTICLKGYTGAFPLCSISNSKSCVVANLATNSNSVVNYKASNIKAGVKLGTITGTLGSEFCGEGTRWDSNSLKCIKNK
jgi:hypothetical protein